MKKSKLFFCCIRTASRSGGTKAIESNAVWFWRLVEPITPQGESKWLSVIGFQLLVDREIEALIPKFFDLSPAGLNKMLDLKKPGYVATAALGHFGREGKRFTWEKTDKAAALKKAVKV
ncbi:MAG: methionine adenosyltransferase domain-containing protein [Fibrobacteraceae bacterium]|nr:methionine adenosyltransferase domain-containing protein [Fibrobacteraceae bacterium]